MDEGSVIEALNIVQGAAEGAQLCALGYHAWVPWLQLPSGSWATWCVRCRHHEQYDF